MADEPRRMPLTLDGTPPPGTAAGWGGGAPWRPAATDGTPDTWARDHLDAEASNVANTGSGGRSNALRRAAWIVGGYVGAGRLDAGEAEARLTEAGEACGLPVAEVRRTVRKGLRAGASQPFDTPPPRTRGGRTSTARPRAVRLVTAKREPPVRPPAVEVAALWAACLPVTDDPVVRAWLARRGLDPAKVEDRDLARALPADLDVPRWARCRGKRWTAGWRCILRAWGPTGEAESLRARWTGDGEAPEGVKETAAADADAGGLVYADPLAVELLRTGAPPEGWGAGPPPPLVVAEGAPDFLTWAVRWSDAAEDAPAVFAVWQGGWTWDMGRRVPNGARVALRPHQDKAGDGYAWRDAWPTLTGRCDVLRPDLAPVPVGGGKAPDDNDLLRAGLLSFDPFEDWHGTDDAAP